MPCVLRDATKSLTWASPPLAPVHLRPSMLNKHAQASIQLFPPVLTHSANSFLCALISTNPGLVSSTRNGLPTKSLSTSPPALCTKPAAPSRSTLPAHTRHWIGRSLGVLATRPRTVRNKPRTVSIEMSRGRDDDGDGSRRVAEAALVARRDWSAECSWAE